ncbi:MAG: glycosyltransferase [Anaerolineae bacterium]|nr:glycosyltransferase [Anaerolineae bacterium]
MRILLITAAIPYPPASGGALRAYGILRGLVEAGHHVTLMSFGDSSQDTGPLRELCDEIITVAEPTRTKIDRLKDLLLSQQADIARRLFSEEFERRLVTLLQQQPFDIVQFEGIEVACYIPAVQQAKNTKIVFDTFNAEAELQRVIAEVDRANPRRWHVAAYSSIQSQRIRQYEGHLCRMADAVIAVSPEDAAHLKRYTPDKHIYVVPSGIHVDAYQAEYETIDLGSNSIVFTGKMDYRPNVDAMLWFVNQILPLVKDEVHVTVVGQKPHKQLEPLLEKPNIKLTGWVDSVLPYLHSTDVYVAPLRMGSGTRLKILEAMACGCAIVATDLAASGLSEDARSAMVIVNEERAFADAISKLLSDPQYRQQLGDKAQEAVRKHYDWSVLIPRLLNVYEGLGLG